MFVIHNERFLNQGFLGVPNTTKNGFILLTIEGKWLETIMDMTKFEFLNLAHPKQVQLLVSICVCGKCKFLGTSTLVGFQEDIQQFIP
jgi:hypothetical protein